MKFNKYFMLGLAGLAFAACSNDENIAPDNSEEGNMYVSLSLGSAKTRSLGNGAVGKYNTVENLKFLFYDGAGNYVPYEVAQALRDEAIEALAGTHQATVKLEGVPSVASTLVIIANEKTSNPIGKGTLAQAEATTIYLKNQALAKEDFTDFSNENSTLTGKKVITANNDGTYSANMTLVPVTARMEVQNFIAVPAPASYLGDEIESFKIAGIYINDFYYEGALAAPLDPNRKKVNNGKGADTDGDGTIDSPQHAYTQDNYEKYNADGITGDFAFLCDEPTYGEGGDAVAKAGAEGEQIDYFYVGEDNKVTSEKKNVIYKVQPAVAGKWWGYTIFRGTPPHMVIKMNVKYKNQATPLTRYITIQKYTRKESSNTDGSIALNSVDRGFVYRMSDIIFDASDLTLTPYETTKTVNAIVDIKEWEAIDIIPNF